MFAKQGARVAGAGVLFLMAGLCLFAAQADKPTPAQQREKLTKTARAGNYNVAYEGLRKLAPDPANDPASVGKDVDQAIYRPTRLGRVEEKHDLREPGITAHPAN